jgi:putative glutamine amidotransferase
MMDMTPLIGIPCRATDDPAPRFFNNQSYVRALEAAGGSAVLIPLLADQAALRAIYERLDGVLLAGGGDVEPDRYGDPERHPTLFGLDPAQDEVETTLVNWALADGRPLLAICRGIQVLNVAIGGTLWQDVPSQRPSDVDHPGKDRPRADVNHLVTIAPQSRLAAIVGDEPLGVNSFHHQAIRQLASGFAVTALAPDGVIEAIESPDSRFVLGVQFHPEEMWSVSERLARLFRAFVQECQAK